MCGGGDLNKMECIVCNRHIEHCMIYIDNILNVYLLMDS